MLNTIYKITNIINGKVYIGKTIYTIEERFKKHKNDYTKESEKDRPLYRAMNKYGFDNFKIELIETNIPDEQINEKEIYYIKYYNSYVGFPNSNGYNATLGGDGKKYKDYDIKDIISFYEQCYNIKEVSRKFNLDPSRIRRMLIANEVEMHPELGVAIAKEKSSKPIYKIDLNKDIILEKFPSRAEANISLGKNKDNGTISDACRARRGHHKAYGFRWYFQKEWDKINYLTRERKMENDEFK